MNYEGKVTYGETLIAVVAKTKTPISILSPTMSEEKKALSENNHHIAESLTNKPDLAVRGCSTTFILLPRIFLYYGQEFCGNLV